ncbi:hypothetical protein QCA50_007112 [Cerrena zonata]|uniref:Uncharacterized protein n=1 Tax=Cerrena zonata TaxID=2478898 RepID=A0AAW0G959_9APHY
MATGLYGPPRGVQVHPGTFQSGTAPIDLSYFRATNLINSTKSHLIYRRTQSSIITEKAKS